MHPPTPKHLETFAKYLAEMKTSGHYGYFEDDYDLFQR